MSWLGFIATPLGYVLKFLYNIIGVYGLSIVALTLIVKLCLYPLYKKQIMSTANMASIQPKMQALQKKYANDKNKLNEEMSKLYKEEGYSPLGGCLPMIVQTIIIMGLFALLRQPMSFMDDNMLYAIHENFLWILDLSQPDHWILPIAAAVATFISTTVSMKTQPQQGQGKAMGLVMRYFFPVMILWMARSYPSGLAIYWFISQVIQIFYNLHFNRLRKKMAEDY
ncbi:MAG: YidC/Oxa1 family membrane protein insertase [Clostridia bacterium]|nr:YidC/Oxa1 family membrane protein insertase [Clostridia bacterium]